MALMFVGLSSAGVLPVMTFEVWRMPVLIRWPTSDDPDGAMLKLWLEHEGVRTVRWDGLVAMSDSRQVDALGRIKEGERVFVRFTRDAAFTKWGEGPNTELLVQVGNHCWALPGYLWMQRDNADCN